MSEGQKNVSSFERPTAVTIIAIGNIVFALLCICISCSWFATPIMAEFQKSMFQWAEQWYEAEQKKEIARLLQKRQAAKTQQEKQQIDAKIAAIKASTIPNMSKIFGAFTTPQMKAYFYGIGAIGTVLNLLFLVSGIGLLSMASWARKLAIGASIAYILEHLFSTVYNTVVIAPIMGQAMHEWFKEMQQMAPPGAPPPPPMPSMVTLMKIWSMAGGLFSMALYCAWPITVLVVLFLPHVREAFRFVSSKS